MSDLPRWAVLEDVFAQWCAERGFDENDESWRAFSFWVDENPGVVR